MPDSSKRLARAGRILAAMLIGLVALEGYAQLTRYVGYRTSRVVETTARDEGLLEDLERGEGTLPADGTRILILGDSMAYSPGVAYEDVWSTLLGQRIRAGIDPAAVVVNAALADTTMWIHLKRACRFVPLLKPDIVLVMYNYNDVNLKEHFREEGGADADSGGGPGESRQRPGERSASPQSPEERKVYGRAMLGRLLYWIKTHSLAMRGILPRINMQLKAWGVVIPGSEFHHLSRIAYTPEFQSWRDTQKLLLELRDVCAVDGATLVIYVLPQFHTLRRDLLSGPRRALSTYLHEIGVPNGYGFEHFKGRPWEELAVSPFDGHPNVQANREIADLLYDWLGESAGLGGSVMKGQAGVPEPRR